MIVHVLVAGVDGIGESVRGVFSTRDAARKAAKDVPRSSPKTTWKEVAENYWQAGEEYVLLELWTVDENIFEGLKPVDDEINAATPKYFQDSFDFSETFEKNIAVDTISDTDLYAIWHAQNLETEML